MAHAGWYTDPLDPSGVRWWDGTRWGTETGAVTTPAGARGNGGGAGGHLVPAHPPPGSAIDGGPGRSRFGATAGAPPAPPPVDRGGKPPTNGFAIAALVLGIIGGSVLAIVFGHVARSQIRNSGGSQGGMGMATAGLVLGYLGLALLIVYFVFLGVLISSLDSGY